MKRLLFKKYAIALLVPLLAAVCQWWLWKWLSPDRFILLYPAVMISSWYGGFYAGMLSTAVAVLSVDYFFIAPLFATGVDAHEARQFLFFAIICVFLSYMNRKIFSRQRLPAEGASSEEQLRLITSTVPALISYLDTQEKYLFSNATFDKWFGPPRASVVGFTLREVIGEGAYAKVSPYVKRALAGERVQYETQILMPNGKSPVINVIYTPDFGPGGILRGFVALITDITHQKQAEEGRRKSERRFEVVVEQSPFSFQIFDPQGFSVYANPAWERLWDADRSQLQGYNILKDPHAEASETFTMMQKAFAGEAVTLPDIEYDPAKINQNGRVRWIRTHFFPIKSEAGELLEVVQLMEDITDSRMRLKASEAALATRDEFMSIASHELKTPLTALMLQAQVRELYLKTGNLTAISEDRLAQMIAADVKQIDRITRLVDDMLDISRINTGKLSMELEPCDLCTLTRETVTSIAPRFSSANVDLTVSCSELQIIGQWDRYRIEQVVLNILTNALKYGAGKPVQVEVSCEGRCAVVSVHDQGIGIATHDQQRVFGRFERAVSLKEISGLGLGLYIVRQIVEAHSGHVSVQSKIDQGSTFKVMLPLMTE